jgi:cytochrome c biogenesis protein CcmG/thiol:disulfide interchange protein DsbE
VTLVNVWASWCVPCRDEHPYLVELGRSHGVRLVGINYKDNPENARRFLGALGSPFRAIGVDPSGRTAVDWGVYGVPESFIVDGAGTIRYKVIGPIASKDTLTTILAELEKAKSPR